MPYFNYKAIDKNGAGFKSAGFYSTESDFLTQISRKKLNLVSYKRKQIKPTKVKSQDLQFLFSYIRRLAAIGVSIMESLESFVSETRNVKTKTLGLFLMEKLSEGNQLSSAMKALPNVFSPKECSIMEFAERSNNLPYACENIVKDLENAKKLSSKLIKSITYPAFLLVIIIAIFSFSAKVVIPKFMGLLGTFNSSTPYQIEIMLKVYAFLENNILLIIASAIMGTVVNILLIKISTSYRFAVSRVTTKLPVFGKLIVIVNLTRFFSALSNMQKSDADLITSLKEASLVIQNYSIRKDVENAISNVQNGNKLYYALRHYHYIPRLMQRLIRTGEEGGSFVQSLDDLCVFYFDEIEQKVDRILAFIKPVSMLLIAGMLAVIVGNIFLPMYKNIYASAGSM